jgi:preprotein translocase subunit SecB
VKASFEVREASGGTTVFVQLTLGSSNNRKDGSRHDFSLALVGSFEMSDVPDVDQGRRLISINAPAMLYGVARGVLVSATALSPSGVLLLPSVNLVEALRPRPD